MGTDDSLYKRALEARTRAENNKKGISGDEVDDLLELMKLGEIISKLDMDKVAQEKIERLSERNRIVHELLTSNKDVDRRLKLAKAKPKRKKLHWKTREKRRKDYYKRVLVPRAKARKAAVLGDKGWYPLLAEQWRRAGLQVLLTQEEWDTFILPELGERTPNVHRYDATGAIELGNIWVTARSVRGSTSTVFDGMEFKLRSDGYIL